MKIAKIAKPLQGKSKKTVGASKFAESKKKKESIKINIGIAQRLMMYENRRNAHQETAKKDPINEAIRKLKTMGNPQFKRRTSKFKTSELSAKDETSNLQWLINPYGTFKKFWETFKFLLLVYTFIILPLKVTFFSEGANKVDIDYLFEKFIDLVFLIDLFLNFFTPVMDKYDLAFSHKKIAKIYLKGWFSLDVLALIPFEEIVTAFVKSDSVDALTLLLRIIKVLRLVRLIKLVRLFKSFDFKNNENYIIGFLGTNLKGTVFLLVLPNFMLIVFSAHVFSCIWFFIADTNTTDQSWLILSDFLDQSLFDQYIVAFYFVIQTFTTCGYGDINSDSSAILERYFRIGIMICGVLLYSLFSGQVVDYRSSKLAEEELFSLKCKKLDQIQADFCLPASITEHVVEQMKELRRVEAKSEFEFTNLTQAEKELFFYFKYVNKFSGVRLFEEDLEYKQFIITLGDYVKKRTMSKDQIIYERGEPAATFFILFSGSVHVCSEITVHLPVATIKNGFFGEYELSENCYRKFTLVAATDVVLYTLDSYTFKKLFLDSEATEFTDEFKRKAKERWARFHNLSFELEWRLKRKLFWRFALKGYKKSTLNKKRFNKYLRKYAVVQEIAEGSSSDERQKEK